MTEAFTVRAMAEATVRLLSFDTARLKLVADTVESRGLQH
jgi:hypothetical protein